MLWQILITSEVTRRDFLTQLLGQLEPQIAALGLNRFDQVDVMVHEDQTGKLYGEPSEIGAMREYMRGKATGDYINFIDSDDLIAPDYVSSILPLLDGIDQIGFDVRCYVDRIPIGTASHSLQHGRWHQEPLNGRIGDRVKFCRDISHLNPMRRELAMRAKMAGGVGEDNRWANDMRALGIVKTEHYLARMMYHYLWRGQKNDAKDAFDPWRLKMIEDLGTTTCD